MSDETKWKWLEEIEVRMKSQSLFSPALHNFQSEQLIACVKEMRKVLQEYVDRNQPGAPGDYFSADGGRIANETLTRCASGVFDENDVKSQGEFNG